MAVLDASARSEHELFVELLTVPDRFRELLAGHGTYEAIDPILRARPDPCVWSALEVVVHVADTLHAAARAVVALEDGGRARATIPVHVDAPRADANSAPVRAVLGYLQAAAVDLGRVADRAGAAQAREIVATALRQTRRHLADTAALLDTAHAARHNHGGTITVVIGAVVGAIARRWTE